MATKTIASFTEFKAAVEDGVTDEIILAADITFESGIKIPATEKTLTINGENHKITDMNSLSASSALYVPTGFGTSTITVKNATWSGRNYYGMVCVYDDTANSGVSIVFENVKYNGPQAIYNRYGSTTVKNCDITIEKNGSSASAQEFCETNRLILAGTTTINCLSTSGSVMWFAFAGASITIEADAVINISAPNTYLIYSDTAAKPKLVFMHGSSTVINVKNGLFYAAGTGAHIVSSCLIEHDASLSVTSSANNGVPLFKCSGDFNLMQNASLFLVMPQSGSSPLMYFSTSAKVNFQSPKNILLYNNNGKVFSFASGGTVTVSAKQVNYWNKSVTPYSAAGGFDDVPTTAIYKADGENVSISQTLTQSAVTATTSNIVEGDGGYPVGATNFDLTKATVFSAGVLPLSINAVNDISSVVSGLTDSNASIKLIDAEQTLSANSDDTGVYSVNTNRNPTVGEIITVRANKSFLTTKNTVTVTGSVSITKLPDIPFNAIGTPRRSAPLGRLSPNWEIELTDTRKNGGKWALYVQIESELQTSESIIAEAVTFTDDDTVILNSSPTLVAEGVTDGAQTIRLSWDKTKGVLLNVAEDKVYDGGKYVAKLKWTTEYD